MIREKNKNKNRNREDKKITPQELKNPHINTKSKKFDEKKSIRGKNLFKHQRIMNSILRHETKNSLQKISGYLELLDEEKIPQNQVSKINNISITIEEILELINKIKKVENLENLENYSRNVVNVKEVLEKLISKHKNFAEHKGMKIKSSIQDHNIKAGPCIEEIFSTIIENAIQHSNGDIIQVKTDKINNKVKISVEDDGIGIPEEKRNKIFKKGFKRDSNGSGMGLYLAKEIIKMYDGKLKIKDSKLGGAKFDLYLKLEN